MAPCPAIDDRGEKVFRYSFRFSRQHYMVHHGSTISCYDKSIMNLVYYPLELCAVGLGLR